MIDAFKAILTALRNDQSVVRASVMQSSGSTPRGAGACMVICADGTTIGTIGGGTVENATHIAALKMTPGTSQVQDFNLSNTDAASHGMVCGGAMTILLESYLPTNENIAFVQEVINHLSTAMRSEIRTRLTTENDILHRQIAPHSESKQTPGTTPSVHSTDNGLLFIEPLPIAPTVHFIGAGHVAQATAHLAAFTGFRVHVVDDREDFANATRFPDAHAIHVANDLNSCLPDTLAAEDSVVIMTRGHLYDKDVLAQALRTNAGYIGMIGSTKKKSAVYNALLKQGYTQGDFKRVHCPIGLAIHADTPEEIAISIMAELISKKKHPAKQ